MAHARREHLTDIEDVLGAVRSLPGVTERGPGIFYLGRASFLHFHTCGGERWADARAGLTWGPEMPLPFGASARARATFVEQVRQRYGACRAARSGRAATT